MAEEGGTHDADLPDLIEDGENPGWKIRVGVSRQEVIILAEAERQGIWFDIEDEMRAYVRKALDARQAQSRTHPSAQPGSPGFRWVSRMSLASGEAWAMLELESPASKMNSAMAPLGAKDTKLPLTKAP